MTLLFGTFCDLCDSHRSLLVRKQRSPTAAIARLELVVDPGQDVLSVEERRAPVGERSGFGRRSKDGCWGVNGAAYMAVAWSVGLVLVLSTSVHKMLAIAI